MARASRTDWARVAAMTDEDLEALIAGDPDEGVYADASPPSPAADAAGFVAIPVDREVLAWFQAQGPGAAERMAAALRSHMEAQRAAGGA
ncbi:BrnA antitoxin family protein [Paracraurococcus lichenis]|uniref:BrnA antitoxin family protein n=1 Tax=Paracraurococcus lichenis TaxID=3064888 RepID=A0ABT9E281_9PROT|nr:BrnA antitoxin family protein [Paracraurococcus sp. LOR1-02]MDO9710274.1 BrnA antitoxin family protein [Paracraurococcus sp. LOR1-02]